MTMRKIGLTAGLAFAAFLAQAVNWDNALIRGTTPGGKLFFEPGEEMAFTLVLEGVKEALPPDTYFVDWERRGDDGLVEKGRAPLPFPKDGLVLKTKSAKPGFVCLEANVVTGGASPRTTAGRSACSSRAARGCVRTRSRWRRSRRTTTRSGRPA